MTLIGKVPMSSMLRKEIDKRVEKLNLKLQGADPALIQKQIKEVTEARDVISRPSIKASLTKELERLKVDLKGADTTTIKDELKLWIPVLAFIDGHPDYKGRKAGGGRKGR